MAFHSRYIAFLSLLLLRLVASPLVAASSTRSDQIEWTTAGPQKHLGPNAPSQSPFTYVIAPAAVIRAAQKVLGGKPDSWYVRHVQHFPKLTLSGKGGFEIVSIFSNGRSFICLIQGTQWKRLNTPQGLPRISEVLGSSLKLPADQYNTEALSSFVGNVAYLYGGPGKAVLAQTSLGEVESFTRDPGGKPDKNATLFRALCADPMASFDNGTWVITSNLITTEGAVEKWAVTLNTAKRAEVINITTKQICKPGTYYWNSYD